MASTSQPGYDRTVSLTATDEVAGEDVDWSGFDPTKTDRPVYQTMEELRNLILDELDEVHATKTSFEARELELIRLAKAKGATWEEIGDRIGTSRQTAHRAYAPLVG